MHTLKPDIFHQNLPECNICRNMHTLKPYIFHQVLADRRKSGCNQSFVLLRSATLTKPNFGEEKSATICLCMFVPWRGTTKRCSSEVGAACTAANNHQVMMSTQVKWLFTSNAISSSGSVHDLMLSGIDGCHHGLCALECQ